MRVGLLLRYANGGFFSGDRLWLVFCWWLCSFKDLARLRRPAVGMGKRIATLQLFCEPGSERLLMVTDKVICQITDGEVFKEQALGQRAEVRFQLSDYL